jgi:hypothetical protein
MPAPFPRRPADQGTESGTADHFLGGVSAFSLALDFISVGEKWVGGAFDDDVREFQRELRTAGLFPADDACAKRP